MKRYVSNIALIAMLFVSHAAVASMAFNPPVPYQPRQLASCRNYHEFMKQYAGREYLIITLDNYINMDWLRGAMIALYYDGYRNDNDVASVLWSLMRNVVNFTANLPKNRNNFEFRERMWQALQRSIEEVRRQDNQQRYGQPESYRQ